MLTWLCIGSGISGTMWLIMLLVLMLLSLDGSVPSNLFPGLVIDYLEAGYAFVVLICFLIAVGITAVLLMWNLKKAGFYLYATTKTLLYFLPVIFLGTNHLTFLGLVLTSVFITLYGILLTNRRNKVKNG